MAVRFDFALRRHLNHRCYINARYAAHFADAGLVSFPDFPPAFGAIERKPHRAPLLRTRPFALPNEPDVELVYKEYLRDDGWRFVGRASKARREFENAIRLAELGLPAVEPIAWGEERDRLGRLRRAFVITRNI